MSLTRRQFLAGGAAGAVALGLPRAHASTARRPTAFVQLFLHGGIDQILTTNPRRRGEVDPRVDVPYEEHDIVTQGGVRVGPLLAGLGPLLERVAIVSGVRVMSLAHKTATDNVRQMRSLVVNDQDPGIATTIGARLRGGRPLDSVILGTGWSVAAGYRPMGRCLTLDYLDDQPSLLEVACKLRNDSRHAAVLSSLLARQLAAPGGDDRLAIETAADFLRALPPQAPGAPTLEASGRGSAELGRQLRDAAYLLRHGLTRSIYLDVQYNYDSHMRNLAVQTDGMALAVAAVRWLDRELRTMPGDAGGTLADETLIYVSSELGRFPFLNQWAGKDHFPEISALLLGGGVRPGQYGDTDRCLTGQPISMSTGRPSARSSDRVMSIDDLGLTLLEHFGVKEPRSRGYVGRPLDFLVA